jgi:hypothetical protein
MWINLAKLGRVLYIDLPLSCFRLHDASNTSNKEGKGRCTIYTDWEVIVDQALAAGSITKSEALESYRKLEFLFRENMEAEKSLYDHAERLALKISAMEQTLRLEMELSLGKWRRFLRYLSSAIRFRTVEGKK